MADINLQVGQNVGGVFTLYDNVTSGAINAVLSNQQVISNSNPEFADFSLNPGNQNMVMAHGVAVGSGTLVVSAHAEYTDAGDGSFHSEDFTVTKTFEVVGVPNGAHLDLVFP